MKVKGVQLSANKLKMLLVMVYSISNIRIHDLHCCLYLLKCRTLKKLIKFSQTVAQFIWLDVVWSTLTHCCAAAQTYWVMKLSSCSQAQKVRLSAVSDSDVTHNKWGSAWQKSDFMQQPWTFHRKFWTAVSFIVLLKVGGEVSPVWARIYNRFSPELPGQKACTQIMVIITTCHCEQLHFSGKLQCFSVNEPAVSFIASILLFLVLRNNISVADLVSNKSLNYNRVKSVLWFSFFLFLFVVFLIVNLFMTLFKRKICMTPENRRWSFENVSFYSFMSLLEFLKGELFCKFYFLHVFVLPFWV